MKLKKLPGVIAPMIAVGLASLLFTGCTQGTMSSSLTSGTAGTNSAAMVVTVGDAPLNNILSAKVTVSAASLTPSGGGSNVTLLAHSHTIELSNLGAIQEPLETDNIATGTYSALNVAISSATVTYTDSNGTVVTGTATIGSPNVTITLSPALQVVQGQDMHLSVNFNLAQSFDLTGTTLTFKPVITSAAASLEKESEVNREVEVTGSVVSISATSITVQSAATGVQSTFAINSSTQFSANTTASSIKPGAIVAVHGTVQTDGSLLATMIAAAMHGDAVTGMQGGGRGIVSAVTTNGNGQVTAFTFVPREDFGNMSSNMPLTVSLTSSTTYGVSQDAIQAGIAATAFTNMEIFPGQSVQVIGTMATGSITAQEVDLAPESLSGTLVAAPQGAAPTYLFTLQLPAASLLTTYDALTKLSATTQSQTQYKDNLTASSFASLAAGTNLEVHGYLLVDSSKNYTLTATDINQVGSDN